MCCPPSALRGAAGFRQWRALLGLLLHCEAAPLSPAHSPLFAELLATLRAQVGPARLAGPHALRPRPIAAPPTTCSSPTISHRHLPPPPPSLFHTPQVALTAGQGAEGPGAGAQGAAGVGALVEEALSEGGGRQCFLRRDLAVFFEVGREGGRVGGRGARGEHRGAARGAFLAWGAWLCGACRSAPPPRCGGQVLREAEAGQVEPALRREVGGRADGP